MAEVSVIVPVYQSERLVGTCVQSVLDQSFQDWELVLVDDGSKDDSGKICDAFAAEDSRILVLHQENAGVSEARNAGLAAARGTYIAFLDSDDRFQPDLLEKLVSAVKEHGADSAGCGHFNERPEGRREAERAPLCTGVYGPEEIKNAVVRPLLRHRVEGQLFNGFIWRFLYKADIIRQNGIQFSGAYLEDEVFLIEYFSLAKKLAVIDEPLYIYLWNPDSVTRKYLKDYPRVFSTSLEHKRRLVSRYAIDGIDGWELHTCWAGLLIAVGNEFAPCNPAGFFQRRRNLIALCKAQPFGECIGKLNPKGVAGNKKIVVRLIRAKQYTLLSLLYAMKNTGR
jgi:glycosyltransferase EpsJ